jgi:Flp pilus assembly protein TadG
VSRRTCHDDAGMVMIWTVVVALACLLMVGLLLDGGAVLRSRSRSFDLAGAAARAGVQELDPVALTEGRVALDLAAARQVAQDYLAAHDVRGEVTVSALEIEVTVSDTVHLQMLQPASVTVTETATARAVKGAA